MGGIGSGRKNQVGKATTRDHLALDIRSWKREGLLEEGMEFNWFWPLDDNKTSSIHVQIEIDQARLIYMLGTPNDLNEGNQDNTVQFTKTKCNFGGTRVWFRCPAAGCGRRVAILYFDGFFACRHCLRLAYDSQREVRADRAIRIAYRLSRRLGWYGSILDSPGSKPKGMHRTTYRKLHARYEALLTIVKEHARKKFGIGVL